MKKRCFLALCLLMLFLPRHTFAETKIPILVYHSIAEFKGHGSKELYVAPEEFEKQMLYLREHGFTPLTFEQWEEAEKAAKPIFLTFDDGYKNNLNAYAIFQKVKTETFAPKGTFFVISDFIGRQGRLSKEELNSMAASGIISVESHTATHPDLTRAEDLQAELKASKDAIEKVTGKPVMALAYPYGNTNKKVIAETKKYYDFGLTTTPSYYVKSGSEDERYLLPRLYVTYSTSLPEFAELVEGK